MVEESTGFSGFSSLLGRPFEVYLGTVLYEVSLGSYHHFIRTAPDSNELRKFLIGIKNLQERLDQYRERLTDTIIRINLPEDLYGSIPSERRPEADEYLPRLSFRVQELQVTEIGFVEGSVRGRARIVLRGVFEVIQVAAGVAAITGVSLADFVGQGRDQLSREAIEAFRGAHTEGNDDADIPVNMNGDYVLVDQPSLYMSTPERVERDIASVIMKETGISRPKPRPAQ